jgi:hypothetical protein
VGSLATRVGGSVHAWLADARAQRQARAQVHGREILRPDVKVKVIEGGLMVGALKSKSHWEERPRVAWHGGRW